ncbi:MAG: hypothetical protein IKC87_05155 [Clostridia bacterium]|nr:hypothetical protein [Clostridia bacterium]
MARLERGIEIERKFVIEMPDLAVLVGMPEYTVSDIEQTYLLSLQGVTHRVRSRRYGTDVHYFETKKTRIDKMSVIEEEAEITEAEYKRLLLLIDPDTRTLRKTRHTFFYEGLTVEIDIYPEWSSTAILECELPSRERNISLPDFIKIVKEVTGEFGYSNAAMSHSFPEELI